MKYRDDDAIRAARRARIRQYKQKRREPGDQHLARRKPRPRRIWEHDG